MLLSLPPLTLYSPAAEDRNIQEYATALDARLESERIKQELMEKEHDLWNY